MVDAHLTIDFSLCQYRKVRNTYTKESLEAAIKDQVTWAGVCRVFGIKSSTGAQTHLQRRAKYFGIDTSHFSGQGWSKGKTLLSQQVSIETYLVKGSKISSVKLRNKLLLCGIKEAKCELCGGTEWRGRPIPLELHHKNSDHWDNRLDNLQVVCPNCHAQETVDNRRMGTPTVSGLT